MIDEGRLNIGTDKVLKTLKCQQQNSDKHSNWTGSIKVVDFNMSTTDNRNYGVPNFQTGLINHGVPNVATRPVT